MSAFITSQQLADTDIFATFGQSVSYYHQSGTTDTITAIWVTDQNLSQDSKESGTLTVLVSDLTEATAKNDEVTIGAYIYRVVLVDNPDDAGVQDLSLRFLRDA